MDIGISAGITDAHAVAAAVRSVSSPRVDRLDDLLAADLAVLLVSGREEIATVANAAVDIPLLVLEEPTGVMPIAPEDVPDALESIKAGEATPIAHATLTVEPTGADPTRGIWDAIVMTSDPASISEYAIRQDHAKVAQYRADGVAVASPPASHAYTRAAGGSILGLGVSAFSVVPISPYRTDPDHWVLDGAVHIDVTRDEGNVALFVDGNEQDAIGSNEGVTITAGPAYETIRVPQCRSPFVQGN